MADTAPLLKHRDGPVVELTLNRPDALNALNQELSSVLVATFKALSQDTSVRAIILTGAGRAFCAGVDLKDVAAKTSVADAFDWNGAESLYDVAKACPHPIITAVNGYAITGGLELALLGDFLIASDAAVFADTHARVGITPSWGLTQVLPRLIGLNHARQMSLTGDFVDAQKALDWGLVNEVLPTDALLPRARDLAHQIAETDQVTLGRIRNLIADGANLPFPDAMALETQVFNAHIQTVTPQTLESNRQRVVARGRARKIT